MNRRIALLLTLAGLGLTSGEASACWFRCHRPKPVVAEVQPCVTNEAVVTEKGQATTNENKEKSIEETDKQRSSVADSDKNKSQPETEEEKKMWQELIKEKLAEAADYELLWKDASPTERKKHYDEMKKIQKEESEKAEKAEKDKKPESEKKND